MSDIHDYAGELEGLDDIQDDDWWVEALNAPTATISITKEDMPVVRNDDPADWDWMHTLPGYENEEDIIRRQKPNAEDNIDNE